jgi:hypothetical protein
VLEKIVRKGGVGASASDVSWKNWFANSLPYFNTLTN